MKLSLKLFAVFFLVTLSVIFSGSCEVREDTVPPEISRGDYPPVSKEIMQSELTKIDGTKFKLEDYKGKVVLVNLWATWCGPCREEIPDFVELQDQYRDKNFEVVGIDVDENEDAEMIKKFGEKFNINYALAKSESDFHRQFLKITKVDAIPQTFIIDREGRLVGAFVGGGEKAVEKIKTTVRRFVG